MPESILCPTPSNAISDQRRHDPAGFGYGSVEIETVSRWLKFCNRETSLGPNRAGVSIAVLKKWVACGSIFRLLDCIHWAAQAPALSFLTSMNPAWRKPGKLSDSRDKTLTRT